MIIVQSHDPRRQSHLDVGLNRNLSARHFEPGRLTLFAQRERDEWNGCGAGAFDTKRLDQFVHLMSKSLGRRRRAVVAQIREWCGVPT